MKNFEWKIKIKQQQTTQNDLQRKKRNCRFDLKILKILLQAWYQSANFVKKTFCEPNKCWHLQAECHYCHQIRHIAKFCKKKAAPQASLRRVVTYAQIVPCFFNPRQPKELAFCTVNAKFSKSSVEKIIINSGTTHQFFSNRAYFFKYEKYYHEFQTGSGEVLVAYGYWDVVLRLAHADRSEVIWAIKKVSWILSLGHNLLSTIPLAKKEIKVLQRQVQVLSEISH